MNSTSLPRHPEASQIPAHGHSFIKGKAIWSVLGQGPRVGKVSCIAVGQRRPGAEPCWESSSGSRDRREQGQQPCHQPRLGALQGDRVRRRPRCHIQHPRGLGKGRNPELSLWDFSDVLREKKEKESLGMDLGKEQDGKRPVNSSYLLPGVLPTRQQQSN